MANSVTVRALEGEVHPPEGYKPDVIFPDSIWGNRIIKVFRLNGKIESYLDEQLRQLSSKLANKNPDTQICGGFGGEDGYGQDFENSVFEMHPYAWDSSCSCSIEARTDEWHKSNPHSNACSSQQSDGAECICDHEEREAEWDHANPHEPDCNLVLPNFKCDDFELRWYKYIGRDMKVSRPMSLTKLDMLFKKCRESLR